MKVTLKFDMEDENDAFKYNAVLRAPQMFHSLVEYGNWLRSVCKHGDPYTVNAEACKDKFWEILNENKVDLEI